MPTIFNEYLPFSSSFNDSGLNTFTLSLVLVIFIRCHLNNLLCICQLSFISFPSCCAVLWCCCVCMRGKPRLIPSQMWNKFHLFAYQILTLWKRKDGDCGGESFTAHTDQVWFVGVYLQYIVGFCHLEFVPANRHITVKPLYTDIQYNDKTHYNNNLNGTNPFAEDEMDYWRNYWILYLILQETYVADIC